MADGETQCCTSIARRVVDYGVGGGNENYDAIATLKWMNEEVYKHFPNACHCGRIDGFPWCFCTDSMGGLTTGTVEHGRLDDDILSRRSGNEVHHGRLLTLVYAHSETMCHCLTIAISFMVKALSITRCRVMSGSKRPNLRCIHGLHVRTAEWSLTLWGLSLARQQKLEPWPTAVVLTRRTSPRMPKTLKIWTIFAVMKLRCMIWTSTHGFRWWRIQDSAESNILAHKRILMIDEACAGGIELYASSSTKHFRLGVPAQGRV